MLGRTFNESENQPGQDGVVLLGYGLWKTRFGDASVLAKTLELNGRVRTVIGVKRQYPDLDKDESLVVNPMFEDTVGQIRPTLIMILGAVAFVLLIACANVANLLLAKAAARRREIAVRASLGAAQSRILGQMLTESLTLSAIGGAVGWLCAYAGFHTLLALASATLPRLKD
jgi:ABC-type antimicrobial peptide transport system permease subunit